MDADTLAAMVLGLLLLAACLGGLVWLDAGPVGRHGRDARRSAADEPQPADDDADADGGAVGDAVAARSRPPV